jgi:hypothetical protein
MIAAAFLSADRNTDLCEPSVADDLTVVNQNAAFVLLDQQISPCFATGKSLPVVMDERKSLFVIDRSGARVEVGKQDASVCDSKVSDDLTKVEEYAAYVVGGQVFSECTSTGRFLQVHEDAQGVYVIDAKGERIEIAKTMN